MEQGAREDADAAVLSDPNNAYALRRQGVAKLQCAVRDIEVISRPLLAASAPFPNGAHRYRLRDALPCRTHTCVLLHRCQATRGVFLRWSC